MTSISNDSLKNELASEFIRRNDLVTRWGLTISSFLAIPGLVGFWPMSSVQRSTGSVYDVSGQGRTLTYNGNPTYNHYNSIIPYIDLDGTGDYLSRADEADIDILGTETIYNSSVRGLTVGGWFRRDNAETLMSKWLTTGNQRSWLLGYNSFIVDPLGTFVSSVSVAMTTTPNTATWYFAVGRFDPSSELAIFHNNEKTPNITSIPASIFNSSAGLVIGAREGPTNLFDGQACLCFLSANMLSDALIGSLFHQSRVLFGT